MDNKRVYRIESQEHGDRRRWRAVLSPDILRFFRDEDGRGGVMKRIVRQGIVVMAVWALVACGDPNHETARGYVKAPLETPGLVVRGEEVGEMAELGTPIKPRPVMPSEVAGADADD
jgi:hypothetical protein